MRTKHTNMSVEYFMRVVSRGHLELEEGRLEWSDKMASQFILSLIRANPVGLIILKYKKHEGVHGPELEEIVDGFQRMVVLKKFIDGGLKLRIGAKKDFRFIEEMLEGADGRCRRSKTIKYIVKKFKDKGFVELEFQELPSELWDELLAYQLSVTEIFNDEGVEEEMRRYKARVRRFEKYKRSEQIT